MPTSFSREKGGSRGTPSCQRCSHWGLAAPCTSRRHSSAKESTCSRSSMTSTSYAPPSAHAFCTMRSQKPSSSTQGSQRTWGRHVCGTEPKRSRLVSQTWVRTCGAGQACQWRSAGSGLRVLGSPIGRQEFIAKFCSDRVEECRGFLELLPQIPDPQSAWLLLRMCAEPRQNHLWRSVPPGLAPALGLEHTRDLLNTLSRLVQCPLPALASAGATLPGRLGGVGLRDGTRAAKGAYWGSWCDALPVMRVKAPALCDRIVSSLESENIVPQCISALLAAQEEVRSAGIDRMLQQAGSELPTWQEVRAGARPPRGGEREVGEWKHGWQYWACSALDIDFRNRSVLPALTSDARAVFHSQSHAPGSAWLTAPPTHAFTTLPPALFLTAMRRRLRLPLPALHHAQCPACRHPLGTSGDHYAACPHTGRLRSRGLAFESVWVQVLREAGGTTRPGLMLRDSNLPFIDPADQRRLDAYATGLGVFGGLPLFLDATLVSPLTRDSQPIMYNRQSSAEHGGVALERAQHRKDTTYPELVDSPFCSFVCVASEIGGRWNPSVCTLLHALAKARTRSVARPLRRSVQYGYLLRWQRFVSVHAQRVAAQFLQDTPSPGPAASGEAPFLADVLAEARFEGPA